MTGKRKAPGTRPAPAHRWQSRGSGSHRKCRRQTARDSMVSVATNRLIAPRTAPRSSGWETSPSIAAAFGLPRIGASVAPVARGSAGEGRTRRSVSPPRMSRTIREPGGGQHSGASAFALYDGVGDEGSSVHDARDLCMRDNPPGQGGGRYPRARLATGRRVW